MQRTDFFGEKTGKKMPVDTGPTGRTSYAVCAEAARPTTAERLLVRSAIAGWPIKEDRRLIVKRILNIADCRMGVADGVILAEAPGDGHVVVLDIDNEQDDWASIPWN